MKKWKIKKIKIFILSLAACVFVAGFFVVINELNQKRKIASQDIDELSLSAVEFDLTPYDGVGLQKRIKYRLFENAKWIFDRNNHYLVMGNLKFSNSSGKVVELCDEVAMVELVFQAEGVVVSGDAPKIVLRTKCSTGTAVAAATGVGTATVAAGASVEDGAGSSELMPIAIPWRSIKALSPNASEYRTAAASLFFRSVDDFWPNEWTLHELNLYSTTGSVFLKVTGYEIISIRGFPLNFYFLNQDRWPK